jgi:hypothetical protein
MHLNVNHAFFNDNMHKGISKFLGSWCNHSDSRLKKLLSIVNMQFDLTKILSLTVELEIKSQTLNMFQFH